MPTIEEYRSMVDPLRGYQFRVELPNPPVGSSYIMRMRCQATTLPGFTIEESTSLLGGFEVRHAGRKKHEPTWTTRHEEQTSATIIRDIRRWGNLCHNSRTGIQQVSSFYKRDALVITEDNFRAPVLETKIVGIWPITVNEIQLEGGTSDIVLVETTWSVDYVDPD